MKPETIKAIIATREQIGSLGKSAMNPHGRYAYVSIDTYYERVSSVAAKNGLAWVASQAAFEVMPDVGKTGIIKVTYDVTLMHASGDYIPKFTSLTILHPIQGAQTVGSAMSYLDKVVMRQLFSVATGEKDSDADETNPADIADLGKNAAPKKQDDGLLLDDEPPARPPNTEHAEAIFMEFLPACEDEDQLRQFWTENYKARNILKDHDPEALKRVTTAFAARKNEIKKEAK